MEKAIILAGIKHCGKSTQGKLLAHQLECPFFDTDDVIHFLFKKSPREIYTQQGEAAFMQAELESCNFIKKEIATMGNKKNVSAVIATGGGICNNTAALKVLASVGTMIFLQAPENLAADRIVAEIKYVEGKMTALPAYIAKENPSTEAEVRAVFSEFYKNRCAIYRQIAQATCVLQDAPKPVNTKIILEKLISMGIVNN